MAATIPRSSCSERETSRLSSAMMRVFSLAGALAASSLPAVAQQADRPLAVLNATVVDADGYRPDQTIIVIGDRLAEVGSTKAITVPRGARIVDARGRFVIPGLWDMHVHTTLLGADRLGVFVLNGVTGVRDLGGSPDSVSRWAADVAKGRRIGPRIVWSGLTLAGGSSGGPHIAIVQTEADGRRAVQANAKRGATFIKVWSSVPREAYLGAVDEARRAGLPVVGHLPVAVSLLEALDAGQRGFEHLIGIPIALTKDEPDRLRKLRAAVAAAPSVGGQIGAMTEADAAALSVLDPATAAAAFSAIAGHGAWVCPTLTDTRAYTIMRDSLPVDPRLQFLPPPARDAWVKEATGMTDAEVATWTTLFQGSLRIVREMKRAGVRMLAGTDAGSTYDLPGFDLHTELVLLVRAGLTPLEALTAATRSAAEVAGWRDRAGLVKAGLAADLVVLEANPLAEIGNTRRIEGVIAGGRYWGRAELADLRRRIGDLR
jgi:imidazolonepropionase-like amidohydrolase